MPVLGIRDFARSVSKVIDSVESDREPVIITRHGKPSVAILALDADRWQSLAVAATPQLLRSLELANADLAAGRVESLDDVITELEATEAGPNTQPSTGDGARARTSRGRKSTNSSRGRTKGANSSAGRAMSSANTGGGRSKTTGVSRARSKGASSSSGGRTKSGNPPRGRKTAAKGSKPRAKV
jgi:prevent-host-death family protein